MGYLDTNKARSCALSVNFVDCVDTVRNNVTKYSNHDYSNALLACKIQRIIAHPSMKSFPLCSTTSFCLTAQSPVMMC